MQHLSEEDCERGRVVRSSHHPVAHKEPTRSNLSDQNRLDYWASYYRKSRQLERADAKTWKATREVRGSPSDKNN